MREDGKQRSGGLFGSVVDGFVVGYKMVDCPYCKNQILRTAIKCQHCHEYIKIEEAGTENIKETSPLLRKTINIIIGLFLFICAFCGFVGGFIAAGKHLAAPAITGFLLGLFCFWLGWKTINQKEEPDNVYKEY